MKSQLNSAWKRMGLLTSLLMGGPAWGSIGGSAIEYRQYPTGSILGVSRRYVLTDQDEFNFGVGVNFIYHGDHGVQTSESGTSYGGSLAFRRYLEGWASPYY